jgi:hypothetical protein
VLALIYIKSGRRTAKLTPPLTLSPSRASISAGFQPIGCESHGSATLRCGEAGTPRPRHGPPNQPTVPRTQGHRLPARSTLSIGGTAASCLWHHRPTYFLCCSGIERHPMAVTSFEVATVKYGVLQNSNIRELAFTATTARRAVSAPAENSVYRHGGPHSRSYTLRRVLYCPRLERLLRGRSPQASSSIPSAGCSRPAASATLRRALGISGHPRQNCPGARYAASRFRPLSHVAAAPPPSLRPAPRGPGWRSGGSDRPAAPTTEPGRTRHL